MQRNYKKGYKKKSRFSKYAGYASKGARAIGTVATLARNVNYLRSVINVERKYLDVAAWSAQGVGTAGQLILVNGIAPGSTAITRTGQSVKWVSMLFDGNINISAVATQTVLRLLLVVDSQANGAAMTFAQLLAVTDTNSPLLIGNGNRFRVLFDRRYVFSITGTQIIHVHKYMKLNLHTTFNTGTAGTIADIQTNSMYFLAVSNEATNVPVITLDSRLRFIDN